MRFRICFSIAVICALAGSLCAQNLVQNGTFDDTSAWTVLEHTVPPVTIMDVGYMDDAPALGAAPCLRIASAGNDVSRPIVYQKLTLVAGQEYMVSSAIKILDATPASPAGTWFQIYMSPEEPDPVPEQTIDWNPPYKIFNIDAWGSNIADFVGFDGLFEDGSQSHQVGDGTGLYVPPGEAGAEVDIFLVIKPGQCCRVGSYDVLFDNVSVMPVATDTLSGLADITVVDDAIVSLLYDGTEYIVADGDLTLGATTRWYLDAGVETLWVEGDPAPADTVSGTSNAKQGDVGSKADNFLLTLGGSSNISSIDGIDFQETIFATPSDTFFLFERGGNDAGTWQAILADGSLGAEIAFDKASNGGPYAKTAFKAAGQDAYGVVFKTVEAAMGVRITASGHDTLSISIPTPLLQVPMTSIAPVIDGELDGVWDNVEETQCLITDIVNSASATPESPEDLSATFKVMYDADNIYVFVAVQDSVIDYTFSNHQGDGVEIFFDGDNSKGSTYDGANDTQIRITVDDVELADTDSAISKEGTVFKVVITDSGYNIEASFPLDVLQITPGSLFGFEMQINDNDGAGDRETIMRWFSNDNDSWRDASLFGEAVLTVGEVALKCLFVSESKTAVPDPKDEILVNYLNTKYTVDIATGDDVKNHLYSVDDLKQYDFVFVSESVSSGDTKDLKGAPVPIFYTELWASKWDVTGWVPTNESGTYYGNTTVDETVVKIVDGAHPMSAGFATGAEITIATDSENASDYLTYSAPQIDYIPIATLAADETKVVVMGVEAGTALYNEENVKDGSLVAAARCAAVGINANANNFLTDDAFKLIQAGIDWILAESN